MNVTAPHYAENMCSTCEAFEARLATGSVKVPQLGAVAQVVERLHGMQEARGSSPRSSTFSDMSDSIGYALAGLVAAEGSFWVSQRGQPFTQTGEPRLRFGFGVRMANRDRPLLVSLRDFLACGAIYDAQTPRSPNWLLTTAFSVTSQRDHLERVIPFADRYLLACAKRDQFELWRDQLLAYRLNRPSQYGRGPSQCSVPGCQRPVRGRGKCRHHYYLETGY
jgi:hypothetical protein